jgi:hypothetical protein
MGSSGSKSNPNHDLKWAMKIYRDSYDNNTRWDNLFRDNHKFSDADIDNHKNVIDWRSWSAYYTGITKALVVRYRSRIDMSYLSDNKHLDEDTIREYAKELYLDRVLKYNQISYELAQEIVLDSTISNHSRAYALHYYRFPDSVLEMLMANRNADIYFNVDIGKYQTLSESFMLKHKNELNWKNLSRYQRFSIVFIEQNQSLINWENLSYNKHLSQTVARHYRNNLLDTEEVHNALDAELLVVKPSAAKHKQV